MPDNTPQAYTKIARRHMKSAGTKLQAALKLVILLRFPEANQAALRLAIQDNFNAINYLDDLARNLELTAPPLKP